MKENKITCFACGVKLTEETEYCFDGKRMCQHCYDDMTVTCNNCGERIWRENERGDDAHTLCISCYENCYTNCEDCGRLIHNDDAYYEDGEDYPYCQNCFEKLNDNAIKNYSYKPEPIFYGSGNIFYGVELEIDKGGEENGNAQQLIDIANRNGEHIYCKHDGSIHDGFEIVSHPMTLDYHTNNMNWLGVLEKAIEMEYRSHNTSTCGLHVHVNRSAFGKTYEEQEQVIKRIIFAVEKWWNELVKFSRRTAENLNQWAARYATISSTATETYDKAKGKHMGRYVAVNLENSNTIEFRLFRGTLRYKTFLATLQLVDEICFYAIRLSDKEMEELSWSDFVSRILPNKHELIEYLKLKRLYVNEAVIKGDDI